MSPLALLKSRKVTSPINSPAPTRSFDSTRHELNPILEEIKEIVPPLWPLQDYVAVNPFFGLSDHKFLTAQQLLSRVRDCELLPSADYFRQQITAELIQPADIEQAWEQFRQEYPAYDVFDDPCSLRQAIESHSDSEPRSERQYFTLSETIDREQQTSWTSHIVNDITRHLSAHYDQGQANWTSPWRDLPLYEAWRQSAQISRRMEYLGVPGLRQLATELPEDPSEALAVLLQQLQVPPTQRKTFLLAQIFSVSGWASFVRYRVREAEMKGESNGDFVGLLAIRTAYDVALYRAECAASHFDKSETSLLSRAIPSDTRSDQASIPPVSILARYTLQLAAEIAHRRRLVSRLRSNPTRSQATTDRKAAQLVFCIDVRSEVMRRHLEATSAHVETFGFAGFFGMPIEFQGLGETETVAQCPVLLKPSIRVETTLVGDPAHGERETSRIRETRLRRKIWKAFQTSAISCFSFVESMGLAYLPKLVTDSLRITRPVTRIKSTNLKTLSSSLTCRHATDSSSQSLSLSAQADLAAGMLRNLGLTQGMARLVTLCGHACDVVNNPYRAGLDCGACGGHSGEPNAKFAAQLLNDSSVRAELSRRGLVIPDDTVFFAAVHNTTTDEINFFGTENLPNTHAAEFRELQQWIAEAGERCRSERVLRLNGSDPRDVFRRSRDWSEIRPEWGLAGNAAFIVAPRSRTQGLSLGGRSFLHSYEHRLDPDLKVLELIMTAPMIVTNWINLQYYASAVDNRNFGSGNKAIHNVVGQFGILQGNGGDLMTGLAWQSIHDGQRFQHEPLRLSVIIEAPRANVQQIIEKHTIVRDLVTHGWLSLSVIEDECFYEWSSAETWVQIPA